MAPKTTVPAARPIPAGTPKPATGGIPKPTATGNPNPNPSQPTPPQKLAIRGGPSSVSTGPAQAQKKPSKSDGKCYHKFVPPPKSKGSGPLRKAKPSVKQATQGSASHGQVTGKSSSGTPTSSSSTRNPTASTAQDPGKSVRDSRSRGDERKKKAPPKLVGSEHSLVKIVVYISGGNPDHFFNRHVKAHFTSPQVPTMHETVHAHTTGESGLWEVLRERQRTEAQLVQSNRFLKRMDPVWVLVKKSQETVPADIFTSVNITDQEPTWNYQNFLLDDFKKLVQSGYKTLEWYNEFESELLDQVAEGSLDW